jgi:hypothetical protein
MSTLTLSVLSSSVIMACSGAGSPREDEPIAEGSLAATSAVVRCESFPGFSGDLTYADGTPGRCLADATSGGGWNLVMHVDPNDPDFAWASPMWTMPVTKGTLGPQLFGGHLGGGIKLPYGNRADWTGDLDEILMVGGGSSLRLPVAKSAGIPSFMNFISVFQYSTKGAGFLVTYPAGSLQGFSDMMGVPLPPWAKGDVDTRAGIEPRTSYWEKGGAEIGALVGGRWSPWDFWAAYEIGAGLTEWPYAGVIDRSQAIGPGEPQYSQNTVRIPMVVDIYVRKSILVKQPIGARCTSNSECESGLCDPDSHACVGPQWMSCTADEQCLSRKCEIGPYMVSGVCAGVRGEPCGDDADCASSSCDKASGQCRGRQSEPCTDDIECASGSCDVARGVCTGKQADPCKEDIDCASGTCDPDRGACSGDAGDPCDGDEDCASAYCDSGVHLFEATSSGTCRGGGMGQRGAPCRKNADCVSNACSKTLKRCMENCGRNDKGQQKDAGTCSCAELDAIERRKGRACETIGDEPVCVGERYDEAERCEKLQEEADELDDCIQKRRDVIAACFKGKGDAGHNDWIDKLEDWRGVCSSQLYKYCRTPAPVGPGDTCDPIDPQSGEL